jgi:hypothetical protein
VKCTEPHDQQGNNCADAGNRQNGYYASTYDAAASIDRGFFIRHGFSFFSIQHAGYRLQVDLLHPDRWELIDLTKVKG